jgi:PST family polysaccharide transporter
LADDLKKRSIRGFAWAAGESVGVAAISLVSFIILARLLDPQDFGIFALASVFIFFCNLVTAHGLADALVQRQHVDDDHLDTAFWSTLLLSLVLMAGCLIASGPAAGLLDEPRLAEVLQWLSLSLPLGAASIVQMSIFRREMRFDSVTRRSVMARTLGAIVGIIMAFAGYGIWSLVGQQIVGQLAMSCAFLTASWRPRMRFSFARLRDMWGFGFHVSATQIISGAGEQVLTLTIGAIFGSTALGYFTIAWRAIQLLKSLVSGAVYHVGLSAFSKLQDNRGALSDAFLSATRISSLAGFPIAIGLFLIADPLVHVAFETKWLASVPLLAMLALELLAAFYGMFLTALYRATGRATWVLWMSCAYALTGFAGVMIAAPFGMAVAVGIWVARSLLLMPVHIALVSRVLDLPAWRVASPAFTPSIAGATMAGGILLLQAFLPPNLAPSYVLAIVVPIAAAIYIAVVWLLNPDLIQLLLRTLSVMAPGRRAESSTHQGPPRMKYLKMKRRSVLMAVAAALTPGSLCGIGWLHRSGTPKTVAETLFSDLGTARMIGARYLAQAAHECDAVVLAAELPAGCVVPPASHHDLAGIRKSIDSQRERDFANGDTVIIDGWILARTEARLCALTVLSA